VLSITAGDSILPLLGQISIFLAAALSAYNIFNTKKNTLKQTNIIFLFQILPFFLLVYAFLYDIKSLRLVSEYGGDNLPIFYRISAVWGGRAGPLLLWVFLMSTVTWLISIFHKYDNLLLRILHSWILYLLFISWLLNPFSSYQGIDGELNPLLQTNLMVIHPPIVFAYYSLCIAVASIALSGIIQKIPNQIIHSDLIPWARAGFFVGTLGIGLGGLWAYTVLDWGGYWAWDPVETGSLLPWLTLLLIIHTRAKTHSSDRMSSLPALALITGILTLHATLVTRANGVWSSVHAFVGNEGSTLSQDPYLRIINISDFSPIGLEILSYLIALVFLGIFTIFHLFREQKNILSSGNDTSFFQENNLLSWALLITFVLVSINIGASSVLVVGTSLLFLTLNSSSKKPAFHWIIAGIILMLYSNWSWSSNTYQAFFGMVPFLIPWFLSDEEDFSLLLKPFKKTAERTRIARTIPWYGGATFLLLTWMLLTVEIEGSNILAHEFYGAPLIALLALGLTLYAWGSSVNSRNGNILIISTLFLSVFFAYISDQIYLPGDPELSVTSGISRGSLGLFILTWLIFALPPTVKQLYSTTTNIFSYSSSKNTPGRLRLLGSHLAHFGILLLLIGHVLTTTMVDRTDPSHLVTLVKDEPIEHNGYEFIFTDVEKFTADEEQYPYSIGDGYIGIIIDVFEDGEKIAEISPGMLRFITGNDVSPRSEVDRFSTIYGDTIVILDFYQSQELLEWMTFGQSEEVDRVRVTIHSLPGSHLVWLGWSIIMLGSIFSLSSDSIGQKKLEK